MATAHKIPTVTLNNGIKMPQVGFGTWKLRFGKQTNEAVVEALEAGYRHFDTARIYLNEKSLGRTLQKSAIARKDLFITTKLWNSDQGYDSTLKAFDKSLNRLGMDYVDLYLIHWPVPEKRLESWRALVEIYKSGQAKAIGVSNFTEEHLAELLEHSDVVPAVNQVEFHPFLNQKMLLDYCNTHTIQLEAYSPLVHGRRIDDPAITQIAQTHHKSNAQVILRWNVQLGNVIIPKSTDPERIAQNIDIFDFKLNQAEMVTMEDLNENYRTCWDPTGM